MSLKNNDTTNSPILSMLKKIWQIIGEISNRSEALRIMEKRIADLIEAYGKESQEKFAERLMDLLEMLDEGCKVEKDLVSELETMREVVVKSLEALGFVEIEAMPKSKFDPNRHCAVGIAYDPDVAEGEILEVCRRGFRGERVYYAEVIVAVSREEAEKQEQKENYLGTVENKDVVAAFDGGDVTTDTGVLLLKGVDESIGLVEKLAGAIEEKRDERYLTHEMRDLLAQRIYQIAMGYEDGNDCNALRRDPAFRIALQRDIQGGRDLASQPTMSRFENAVTEEDHKRISEAFLGNFVDSYEREPEIIVLDFDTTDDPVHGAQQMTLFNAYYDEHCYLPMHVYEGLSGKFITAVLRPGKTPTGAEIVSILQPIVEYLRARWQNTIVVFRGDSHFASPELLEYLENNHLLYVVGSSAGSDKPLKSLATLVREEVKTLYLRIKKTIRRYSSFEYQAQSWNRPRRIIARAECSPLGENTRFVITNMMGQAGEIWDELYDIPDRTGECKQIYEDVYCARGNCENYIKDHKTYLKSDRTSCTSFLANQFRLALHSAAYVLLHTLKTQYLKGSAFANATFHTIQLRILKVAARVRSRKTRIRFFLPSSYPLKMLWDSIIKRLFPLRC